MNSQSYKDLSILLIEGRARQVLPMCKALRRLGCQVTTYNTSRLDPGYASRYPSRKILGYCNHKDEQGTLDALKRTLAEHHYDLVIPLNDDIAIILSRHKEELERLTTVGLAPWDTFVKASDKLLTMQACMDNRIPCPLTFGTFEKFKNAGTSLTFPVVCKPRTGCAAVGFHISHDEADLKQYVEKAEQKYGRCLIQEYIPQDGLQYKAEIYIDRNGVLKAACIFSKIRWYPIEGGSSTLNETVDRPDIMELCRQLLKAIDWRGYADIDLIEDTRTGKVKIMEINPRITGSVKICFEAGVNFAKAIVDDFLRQDVEAQFDVKHRYLRFIHTDLLWLVKSPKRFSASPSWFSFRHNSDQIFSWSDPWVFFAFTFQGFGKLLNDKKKRNV